MNMVTQRRYIQGAVLVLSGVVVAVVLLFRWQDARLHDATADERLDNAAYARQLVETGMRQDLASRAQFIAGNQAVTAYVAQALGDVLPGMEVDRDSIADLLEERRRQLGLDIAAVLDGDGEPIASAGDADVGTGFGGDPLFEQARDSGLSGTGLWLQDGRLLLVGVQPLVAYGGGAAYLLVGNAIGRAEAERLAGIGRIEIILAARAPDGISIAGSTLDPALESSLPESLAALGSVEGGRHVELSVGDDSYRAAVEPLFDSPLAHAITLVSARSGAAAFLALRLPILVGGILVLLGVALALLALQTRVLAPAARLAALMERAAETGDIHLTAREEGSAGVRRLSAAFNRLMARLANR
jgi:hypothetical protein